MVVFSHRRPRQAARKHSWRCSRWWCWEKLWTCSCQLQASSLARLNQETMRSILPFQETTLQVPAFFGPFSKTRLNWDTKLQIASASASTEEAKNYFIWKNLTGSIWFNSLELKKTVNPHILVRIIGIPVQPTDPILYPEGNPRSCDMRVRSFTWAAPWSPCEILGGPNLTRCHLQ